MSSSRHRFLIRGSVKAQGPWPVVTLVAGLAGCLSGCDDGRGEQVRALLRGIDAVPQDSPVDEREAALDELERIPVAKADLEELRDLCVRANRTLIEGERAQERARALLDDVVRDLGENATIPPERRAPIEEALEASSAAIAEARAPLERCLEGRARLETEIVRL